MNLATNADMKIAAETLKQLFDELMRVGFSQKQTMELVTKAMEISK